MGAHPKASSKIRIDNETIDLAEVIRNYPIEMLGKKTAKVFSSSLPFLFKVLSANEVLSIQAHPSKKQAIALHTKDPVNYPDSNHKLEIAIALDSLTALVGFKPFNQIIKTLKHYPEISDFIGIEYLKISGKRHSEFISESHLKLLKQFAKGGQHDEKIIIKRVFARLIENSVSDKEELENVLEKLYHRISKKKKRTEIEKYFLKLHNKYNADVGLLILFFLNLVHLKRGEAIFTKPGILHAYLKGNILECMSNSDNVIRAGLTPKHKDIDSLLKVLTYELNLPKIIRGKKKRNSLVYQTEAQEFQLEIYNLNREELKFKNQTGPRILLVLNGSIQIVFHEKHGMRANKYSKGESVFLPSILSDYKITSERSASLAVAAVPQKKDAGSSPALK
jgi:mannose-6-phosphate isomerase